MTPTQLARLRAWYARRLPHTDNDGRTIHTPPTRSEHDTHVTETGRPYTQPSWDLLGRKPHEHHKAERET